MLELINRLHDKLNNHPEQKIDVQQLLIESHTFRVSKKAAMSLMGVGGSEQKRLKEKLGVNIGFNFEKEMDGNIEIKLTQGTLDKYKEAEKELKELVEEIKIKKAGVSSPGETKKTLEVPIEKIGLIKELVVLQ
uniref:Uncharacterized protein n=1 Tax=Ditylenchus dipsaci TaxID=166011 RepID=A0A915ED77_9BILA